MVTKYIAAAILVLVALPITAQEYSRDAYGTWAGSCLSTREHVIIRQAGIQNVTMRDACTIETVTMIDPYTGEQHIDVAGKTIHVDHVYPLASLHATCPMVRNADAAGKREIFNDVDNLIAASAKVNMIKSAKGPASWTPTTKAGRCLYAQTWLKIAAKYSCQPAEADLSAAKLMVKTSC